MCRLDVEFRMNQKVFIIEYSRVSRNIDVQSFRAVVDMVDEYNIVVTYSIWGVCTHGGFRSILSESGRGRWDLFEPNLMFYRSTALARIHSRWLEVLQDCLMMYENNRGLWKRFLHSLYFGLDSDVRYRQVVVHAIWKMASARNENLVNLEHFSPTESP